MEEVIQQLAGFMVEDVSLNLNHNNQPFVWRCICCETEMQDDSGKDDIACWPDIAGGTMSIDCGWKSKFDQGNGVAHRPDRFYQACICDKCLEEKKDFVRHVEVIQTKQQWKPIPFERNNF